MPINIEAASRILSESWAAGARELCICSGSRNSPLIAVATAASGFRRLAFPDERSAAFFALGRAKATGCPVPVITTSGTAVAELLPAVIEAYYSGLPMILITADRPRRFRGTGAPQSIEQRSIFGSYCETSIDIEAGEAFDFSSWNGGRLHLNVGFDEPLIDGEILSLDFVEDSPREVEPAAPVDPSVLQSFLEDHRNPLVIVGHLDQPDRSATESFLAALGAPVYAEALSGLRESEVLRELLITAGERIIARGAFDSILRIGGVPTLRFWRDLETTHARLPVLNVSRSPFPGLSRGTTIVAALRDLLPMLEPSRRPMDSFLEEDRRMAKRLEDLLATAPASELALFRSLSEFVPSGSHLFLGNSLPIREWDLAATRAQRDLSFSANRGANGIDGAISTFLGVAAPGRENWAVVGDLTLMYDLSAPWILAQLESDLVLRLVVINNGGGRIFGRVSALKGVQPPDREKFFENGHDVSFEGWATMWRLPYERWSSVPTSSSLPSRSVIEITPDADATAQAWKKFDELWSIQ